MGSPISQEIKLMLGIPIIPDGTSVSITVKVESSPSGPIVSVGNPTPLAPATPQTPKPDEDAVIVDANSAINQVWKKSTKNSKFESRHCSVASVVRICLKTRKIRLSSVHDNWLVIHMTAGIIY